MNATTPTQLKLEDLTRRQIRYICFRLQTEFETGKTISVPKTGFLSLIEEVKKHMEEQEDFSDWSKFAKTWDVDEKSHLVVVNRRSSIYSDWNKVLKEETKEIPKELATNGHAELPVAPIKTAPPKKKRK
jgi:hypothetical protein